MESDLSKFLVRTVLDTEFRKLALHDPDAAFADYDLSEADRVILRRGDDDMLALLGRVLRESWTEPAAQAESPSPSEAHEPVVGTQANVTEASLRLRLVPVLYETPEGESQYSFAASLHGWSDDRSTWTQSDDGSSSVSSEQGAVDFRINVAAALMAQEQSESTIAYSAVIQPAGTEHETSEVPSKGGDAVMTTGDFCYHSQSNAAREAAKAIQDAEPNQRHAKVLKLIEAIREGDING